MIQFSTLGRLIARHALPVAICIGAAIRCNFVFASSFPLNDGGLFYAMTQDLTANHFALPSFTSYNLAQIPFAYPPLGIYFAALVQAITGIALLDLLRFAPLLVNIICIPLYYNLCRQLLKSDLQAGLAVIFFSIIPRSFSWLIVGGGITRGFGFLFSLLTIYQLYMMLTSRLQKYIVGTCLFGALTALSHPEMTYFTALTGITVFIFFRLQWRSINYLILCAAVIVFLISPWWLTIINTHHGINPFLNAFATGGFSTSIPFLLISTIFSFSEQTLLASIGLLGILQSLLERKWFLPVWLAIVTLGYPRAPQVFAVVPLSMLIAVGIDRIIFPLLQGRKNKLSSQFYASITLLIFLGYGISAAIQTPIVRISPGAPKMMNWISLHTPRASKFLLITNRYWFADSFSEWFPAITNRRSQATVQGLEWLTGRLFEPWQTLHYQLQQCGGQSAECLEVWANVAKVDFTHVLILKSTLQDSVLEHSLEDSTEYHAIYDDPEFVVFERLSGTF